MVKFSADSLGRWGGLVVCGALAACGKEPAPAPTPELAGKWKLEQEYRGNIQYSPSGVITSHDKYSRPGEPEEYLEIGDSAWVFMPSTYSGARDGHYKLTDTTVVVKLSRPTGFNFPAYSRYTISALDAHRVVVREKQEFGTMTNYYKWVLSR